VKALVTVFTLTVVFSLFYFLQNEPVKEVLAPETNLGERNFKQGMEAFLKGDLQLAKEQFSLARENGVTEASYNLALIHEEVRESNQARKMYLESIESGILQAHFNLALLLIRVQEFQNALGHLQASFDLLKDSQAAFLIAQIYERNPSHQNTTLALSWYEKACEHGSADACHRLALAYDYGQLDQMKSASKTLRFYKSAAKLGHAHSQYNLALIEAKNGDLKASILMLKKAASQGLQEAKTALDKLESKK